MPDGLYTSEIDVKFTEDMAAAAEADFAAGKVYTKSDQFNEMVDRLGIVSVTRIFGEDERFAEREHRAGLHLWYRVKLERPSGVTMTKASEELSSIPGIQESSPVMRKKIADFNDPGFGQQWGLYQSSGIDINVSRVWEEFGTGSSDVIVSVIDTGVDLEHEDLAANAIPAGSGGSMNFRGSAPTSSITPGDHGTHVAGVISAVNNNNVGVNGIAGGDAAQGTGGVRLLSCQVGDNDAFDGNTEDAIRYAANNGALICQNSWGYNKQQICSPEEFCAKIRELTDAILSVPGMTGYCYTQLTDVEQEQNGVYNYDRTPKVPVERLFEIFSRNPEF